MILLAAGLGSCAPRAAPGPAPEARRVTAEGGRAYRLVQPAGPARGVLLLLGAPAEAGLPALLAARGVATAMPDIDRETLYVGATTVRTIEAVARDAQRRSGAPAGRVVIGGISLGGTGAVAFAEHCAVGDCAPEAVPRAVFAVDAPLDLDRFWRASVQHLRWDTTGVRALEARWVLQRLALQFGGSPDEQASAYAALSPFLYREPYGGRARLLRDTPLRLYAEPDMGFWLDTMGLDYYQVNAFDAVAMGSRLRHLGNARVEVILTTGRGYRADGERNPHSWAIVDERDLARWLVSYLEAS